MKKTHLGFHRASLLSIIVIASMSFHTAKAQDVALTTANGLYNTGVEVDDLTPVPGDPSGLNNPIDPNYTVSYYANGAGASPAITLPPLVYTPGYYGTPTYSGSAYIANPTISSSYAPFSWASNLPNAQWITYMPNIYTLSNTPATGVSVYQITLTDIPTGDAVTLTGQIAADDNVTIYANGQNLFSNFSVTDNGGNNDGNYDQFNPLGDLSFIADATNTLDFVVYNSGANVTGLNAQLTGFYVVPEPSTYALFAAGLGLLVFASRRKATVSI